MVISASPLCQGEVIGLCAGPSGRLVCSVVGDGVRVVDVASSRGVSTVSRQSWALSSEEPTVYPSGPAIYQRHGGTLCLPMIDTAPQGGVSGGTKHAGKKSRARGQDGKDSKQHFLYVWSLGDVESKNVRHVSRRFKLPKGKAVKSVTPLSENRASVRRLSGDRATSLRWVGGFVVVMDDGEIGIVGGDVQTSGDHKDDVDIGYGVEEVAMLDGMGNNKGDVLGVGVMEGILRVVRRSSDGLLLDQFRLLEYPKMEAIGTVALHAGDVAGAPHPVDAVDAVDAVGIAEDRIMAVAGRMVYMYRIDAQCSEGEALPVVTRVLARDDRAGAAATNKKRKASGTGANTKTTVFVDGMRRGYIIRSDSAMAQVVVLDLMYGSVLWTGWVQGCGGQVSQGAAIFGDTQPGTVELCLASPNNSISCVLAQIPTVSLASVVGSLCLSGSSITSSPLAQHARSVLDAESCVANRPKRLGKVAVELTRDSSEQGKKNASSKSVSSGAAENALLQISRVGWTPSKSSDVEDLEEKLARLLTMDGKMDDKSKADLCKVAALVVEKCKQRRVSLASDVSARALLALIGAKQWKLVSAILEHSHPMSHTHCAGAALALAQHGQCAALFALFRHAPDISPPELTATIKCLISGTDSAATEATKAHFVKSISTKADAELKRLEKSQRSAKDGPYGLSSACLAAAAINGFSAKQVSCHPLLALHPDAALLLSATRRLHSHQIVFLMRYLLQWLENVTELDVVEGGLLPDVPGALVPSLDKLLIWLTAVVDAGNMRLSSSDAGISVLQGLLKEIKSQISCVKGLGDLSGLLEQLERSHKGRHRASGFLAAPGGYTVECLNL